MSSLKQNDKNPKDNKNNTNEKNENEININTGLDKNKTKNKLKNIKIKKERVRFEIPKKYNFNLENAQINIQSSFERQKKSYKDSETLYKYYDIAKDIIGLNEDNTKILKDIEIKKEDYDLLLVNIASLYCETGCSPNSTDLYKIDININDKKVHVEFTTLMLLEIIQRNVNDKLKELIIKQRNNKNLRFNIEFITVRNFVKKLMKRYSEIYKIETAKDYDERKLFKNFNLEYLIDECDGLSDAMPYSLLAGDIAEVMRLYLAIYKVARECNIKMDKNRIKGFISVFHYNNLWKDRVNCRVEAKSKGDSTVFNQEKGIIEKMLRGLDYEDDFLSLYKEE